MTITAEPQTNALIVAVHPDLLPEIQVIIEDLNGSTRQSATDREIRIFSLKVARAAELAKTIDEMYPAPPLSPWSRKCVRKLSRPKPKSPWPWRKPFEKEILESWITKRFATFQLTPICANQSRMTLVSHPQNKNFSRGVARSNPFCCRQSRSMVDKAS